MDRPSVTRLVAATGLDRHLEVKAANVHSNCEVECVGAISLNARVQTERLAA